MTKTLLCGVAAIAFSLAAPTAFAQDADMDVKAKAKAEQMMDATEHAEHHMMDDAADEKEDAEDAMEDKMDTMEDKMDSMEGKMDDTMEMDTDADAEVEADVSTSVDCPSGTESQADGSCMITGDWSPED